MIRTFTFKTYRNVRVERKFGQYLGCARMVYNVAKEVKEAAFKAGVSLSKNDLSKQLTEAKKDIEFLRDVNAQTLQGALDQLDTAYQNFFRKHKSGEIAKMKARYIRKQGKNGGKVKQHRLFNMGKPKWAKKGEFNSVVFKQGTKQTGKGFRLSKFGNIKVHNNRPINGKIKTARLIQKPDGIYLSVVAELPDPIQTDRKNQAVGIDMGIAYFMVTSDGEYVDNPRFLEKQLPALRRAQRSLSRKTKGSSRWMKQKQVVARLHQKVANARKDFLHKTSTELCRNYGTVVREDLNVAGMVKGRLSRHISDVAWSMFFGMTGYKAQQEIKVNPAYTSQECSKCGEIDKASRVSQSAYCCTTCGHTKNADENAAQNILGRALPNGRKRSPLGQTLAVESHRLCVGVCQMDGKGIPKEERDVLPFDKAPTNREVLQRAKDHAEWSAKERSGYTEGANVQYGYRTGFFHAMRVMEGLKITDK